MARLRHLALACLISLGVYIPVHAFLLARPVTHGALAAAVQAGLDRAAAISGPKLVILAGSNAPYSHSCVVLEAELALPCVNGGVAVGIGLDYLFARWDGLLRPGDTVYLPMEPAQYTRSRLATATGPDAAIMARHDRATLATLGPERWIGAALAADLRGVVMALVEMALGRAIRPRVAEPTNAWGDRVGHTAEQAALPALHAMHVHLPDAAAIRGGHGAALIAGFARRMTARGVRVIGGLSTGFADTPLPEDALAAMAEVFTESGAAFLALPNRSRYPRRAFYDGPEHLNEANQVAHSRLLAAALARLPLANPARDITPIRME